MAESKADDSKQVIEVRDRRVVEENEETSAEWRLVVLEDLKDQSVQEVWRPYVINKETGEVEYEPAFLPLPGSQVSFLSCPIFECLLAGNRGGGKTQILLMDYAKDVGKGYGNAWRGILFRRQIGDLDDVVQKIDEWFPKMFPGFRFNRSKGDYAAIFPDGEKLLLRHLSGIDDYSEYHGHQYPWQGFEELNEWENLDAYKAMHSCCRPPTPGVPCRIRATTNPYGPGHSEVKKRFGLPENFGKVIRSKHERDRVAIQSSLAENFVMLHSDPEYPKNIVSAARNSAQARAWLKGDWNVTSGGLVDDLWQDRYHVVPNFQLKHVPQGWDLFRSYDHGQSAPFSVGWWLVSDGTPLHIGDRVIGGVRGDVIRFNEWYGTDGDPNKGVRMASRDIAKGIIDREEDMGRYAQPGPADNQIFDRAADRDRRGPADDMEDEGVYWERSDKSSGSRKRGYEVFRDYLRGSIPEKDGTRDHPGFFVCERCEWFRDLVVTAPRGRKDPDDVPEGYADHILDETRYFLTFDPPYASRSSF